MRPFGQPDPPKPVGEQLSLFSADRAPRGNPRGEFVDRSLSRAAADSTFSVRVSSSDVSAIMDEGQLLSTHHTQTSRGGDSLLLRRRDEHRALPNREAHPIYGYMKRPRNAGGDEAALSLYGDVDLNFSDRATRDRLTVTAGDSRGMLLTHNWLNSVREGGADTPERAGMYDSWDTGERWGDTLMEAQYHPTNPSPPQPTDDHNVYASHLDRHRQGIPLSDVESVDLHVQPAADARLLGPGRGGSWRSLQKSLRAAMPGAAVRRSVAAPWTQPRLSGPEPGKAWDHPGKGWDSFHLGKPQGVPRGVSMYTIPDDDEERASRGEVSPVYTGPLPKKGQPFPQQPKDDV